MNKRPFGFYENIKAEEARAASKRRPMDLDPLWIEDLEPAVIARNEEEQIYQLQQMLLYKKFKQGK